MFLRWEEMKNLPGLKLLIPTVIALWAAGLLKHRTDVEVNLNENDIANLDLGGDVFLKRKQLFQSVCDKYNEFYRPEYRGLYMRDDQKTGEVTSYFKVQGQMNLLITFSKAGSTSWLFYFEEHNIDIGEECDYCPREQLHKVILMVRHPLERLVSGYRHLIESNGWKSVFDEEQWPQYENGFKGLNFSTFVDNLILKQNIISNLTMDMMYDNSDEIPREVIMYWHFAPYWFTIPFCTAQYMPDIIIKTETISRDFGEVRSTLGLPENSVLHRVQSGGKGGSLKEHSSKVLQKYLTQLSARQVSSLNEMYRLDYEFFGYKTPTSA